MVAQSARRACVFQHQLVLRPRAAPQAACHSPACGAIACGAWLVFALSTLQAQCSHDRLVLGKLHALACEGQAATSETDDGGRGRP